MLFTETFCIIIALIFLIFCAGVLAVYLFRGAVTLATAFGIGLSRIAGLFSHKESRSYIDENGIVRLAVFLVIYIVIVVLIANAT